MENRTDKVGVSETPSMFSSRGQNYSILCFLISTMIVFLLSLSLALAALRCYDYCKSRTVRTQVNIRSQGLQALHSLCLQVPMFLYSSPPSYDTVAKIDRTELPSYQQACRHHPNKL